MTQSLQSQSEAQSGQKHLLVTWHSGEEIIDLYAVESALLAFQPGSDMTIQTTEFRNEEKREVAYEPVLAPSRDGFTLTYKDAGNWVDDAGNLHTADGYFGTAHYKRNDAVGGPKWTCHWIGDDKPQERLEIPCKLSNEVRDRRELKALVRDAKFRRRIFGENPQCLVTGEKDKRILEAAHICEVKNQGNDSFDNGIVLRADLHKLFDEHILTINSDGRFAMNPVPESYKYLFQEDEKSWIREPKIEHVLLQRYAQNIEKRNAKRVK